MKIALLHKAVAFFYQATGEKTSDTLIYSKKTNTFTLYELSFIAKFAKKLIESKSLLITYLKKL